MSAMDNAHALVIGIANYHHVNRLPPTVLQDARDVHDLLVDPQHCGYPPGNVQLLLDGAATQAAMRQALADLAERFGAEAAGARAVEREAEREELARQLQSLKRRRELRRLQVDPEVVSAVLAEMRETLEGDDLQAKRVLLKRFVERVEISKESARLVYTFPIADTVFNIVAPWGHHIEYCIEIDLVAAAEGGG